MLIARSTRRVVRVLAGMSLVVCVPASASAQMAGVPVLQGAFIRPGLAVGVNAGSADDGSALGGAVAWGLGGGRFAVSAGAAAFSPPDAFQSPAVTYGGRLAWNAVSFASGAIGVTPFAGGGRVELQREAASGLTADDEAGTLRLLAGVSLGYRRALGTRGVLALFAAPMYVRSRPDGADLPSDDVARVAVGAEVGWTLGFGTVGVTVGFDAGASGSAGQGAPSGGGFGVGVAIARGR